MPRERLLEHLHTRSDQPDVIPYRTSPYHDDWGFCTRHADLAGLTDDEYDVRIDADRFDGSMSYGETVLPRHDRPRGGREHPCLPSVVGQRQGYASQPGGVLSVPGGGHRRPAAPAHLPVPVRARHDPARSHGWRPTRSTSGPSATASSWPASATPGRTPTSRPSPATPSSTGRWPSRCAIAPSPTGSSRSRRGATTSISTTRRAAAALRHISRTAHGEYPAYHTYADGLDFVTDASLVGTLELLLDVVDILEAERPLISTSPYGEPRLGDRGLMSTVSGRTAVTADENARLWIMAMADGQHGLLDAAERSGLPFAAIRRAADRLLGRRPRSATRIAMPMPEAPATPSAVLRGQPRAPGARAAPRRPGGGPHVRQGRRPVSRAWRRVHRARRGCHVWDLDGNEYVEYGMGLRAVTLGHAYPAVVDAVRARAGARHQLRPARAASSSRRRGVPRRCRRRRDGQVLQGRLRRDEAAVRLARAYTGRDLVAICADHPFFSTDDWFIGTTRHARRRPGRGARA